jgi:hypothetical protein
MSRDPNLKRNDDILEDAIKCKDLVNPDYIELARLYTRAYPYATDDHRGRPYSKEAVDAYIEKLLEMSPTLFLGWTGERYS